MEVLGRVPVTMLRAVALAGIIPQEVVVLVVILRVDLAYLAGLVLRPREDLLPEPLTVMTFLVLVGEEAAVQRQVRLEQVAQALFVEGAEAAEVLLQGPVLLNLVALAVSAAR